MADLTPGVTEDIDFAYKSAFADYNIYFKEGSI